MNKMTVNWFDKFLLKHWPNIAMRHLANKMDIQNVVFDKLHEAFDGSDRIDIFPTHGTRGFILILDRETALYFYQEGDHFKYDGFEMGPYEKGDVTIFDHLNNK